MTEPFFDKETIGNVQATKWQLLKARLFGTPFYYSSEDSTVSGYRHNGIVYVKEVSQ